MHLSFRSGISGIVATAFLLTIIAIFITLYVIAMSNLEEMNRAYINYLNERSRLLAAMGSIYGFYSIESNYLVINITNAYSETIRIIAIGIIYANAQHDILSKDTSTTALAKLCSPTNICNSINLELPYTLQTGYTLSIRITPKSTNVVSITVTTSIGSSVISIPIKQYRLITAPPTITPNYEIRYSDVVFQNYTVAVYGYRIITESYTPTKVTTLLGVGIGDVDDLIEKDEETYNVIPTVQARWEEWAEWPYYREVIINNSVDLDLTNYQVRIVLTDTNFNTWYNIAGNNGEDLRFIDEDGNELSYWIEYFSKDDEYAIIWVKVPYIPANSTTKIYMLYGNPNAESHSDGDAVFEFFDDFTQFNTNIWWYNYTTTTPPNISIIASNEFHDGVGLNIGAYYKYQYQYVNVYTKATWNVPSAYGYIVDTRLSPRTNKDNGARLDLYTANSDVNQHPLNANGAYIHAQGRGHKGKGIWLWYFTPDVSMNRDWDNGKNKKFEPKSWWIISIGYFDNETYYYIWNNYDYSEPYAYKIYNNRYDDFRIVLGNEKSKSGKDRFWQEAWYDWIRVRKFVYPEPEIDIGIERSNSIYIASILVGWSDLSSKYLRYVNISLTIESTAITALLRIEHNATGTWVTISEELVSTNTELNDISTTYELISGDLGIKIIIECLSNFTAKIDYVSANIEIAKNPSIYVLSNGSDKLWIYDIAQDTWISIDTKFPSINYPAMYYDTSTHLLWVANDELLYTYDSASNNWKSVDTTLPVSTSYGSILVIADDKIWYGPGGDRLELYVRNLSGIIWNPAPKPEEENLTLTHYSCAEYNGTHILINFGSTDEFYAFSLITGNWTKLEKSPTMYCVGSAWDSDRNVLWVIGRGGTIHYYDPRNNEWKPLEIQPPYYPQTEGDRLVYYNNHLYHIRSDGTRELWVIETK
mgnify:CR=1 FL=1